MAIRAYIFDLDGVLYRGDSPVEYAAEAVARLRAQQPAPHLFFLTNNSTQTRQDYVDKLTRMGIPCTEDEVATSASATAAYLISIGAAGRTVLTVGGPGLHEELANAGMQVIPANRPGHMDEDVRADYVVVGLDRDFRYLTLWRAQQAILNGATFIATNRDGTFPIEGGKVVPGGGSIVAAIEASTATTPTVIGKPEPYGLQALLTVTGLEPQEAVMIGDRADTDILCGNRLGVPTVLVLTGVTSEAQATQLPPEQRPDRILPDLRTLI